MIANLSPKINWGGKVSMCDESTSLIIFYSNLFLQIVIVPFLCKNNPTVESCEKFISKNTRCLHHEIENRLNRPKSKELYFMTTFKLQYSAAAARSSQCICRKTNDCKRIRNRGTKYWRSIYLLHLFMASLFAWLQDLQFRCCGSHGRFFRLKKILLLKGDQVVKGLFKRRNRT